MFGLVALIKPGRNGEIQDNSDSQMHKKYLIDYMHVLKEQTY